MAINSIGNLIYINQASSVASALQSSNTVNNAPVNQSLFQEQLQKVQEVRPTENTHNINDREGDGKNEFFKENSEQKHKHKEQNHREITEESMLMKPENYLLNIKG